MCTVRDFVCTGMCVMEAVLPAAPYTHTHAYRHVPVSMYACMLSSVRVSNCTEVVELNV